MKTGNSKRKVIYREKGSTKNKKQRTYDEICDKVGFTREEVKMVKNFILSLRENSDFGDFLTTKEDFDEFEIEKTRGGGYKYGYNKNSLLPSISVSKIEEFELCESEKNKVALRGEYYACVAIKNLPFVALRTWNITETNLNVYYSWENLSNPNGVEVYFILSFEKNPNGLMDVSNPKLINETNYTVLNTDNSLEFKSLTGFEQTIINKFLKIIGGLNGIYSNYTFSIIDNPKHEETSIKEFEKEFNKITDINQIPDDKITQTIMGYYHCQNPVTILSSSSREIGHGDSPVIDNNRLLEMIDMVPFYKTFRRAVGDEKIFVKISGVPNISLNLLKTFCSSYNEYVVDIIFYSNWFRVQRSVDFQLLLVLDRKATRKINNNTGLSNLSNNNDI